MTELAALFVGLSIGQALKSFGLHFAQTNRRNWHQTRVQEQAGIIVPKACILEHEQDVQHSERPQPGKKKDPDLLTQSAIVGKLPFERYKDELALQDAAHMIALPPSYGVNGSVGVADLQREFMQQQGS